MNSLSATREKLNTVGHDLHLQGTMKKGGKIKKTGAYKLHAGEHVSSSKKEAKLRKKAMKG